MELQTLMKERYAAKQFNSESISNEQLAQLKEYITLAPSSFGLQPFRVKIIDNQDTKQELQAAAYNQPQVTSCSHLLVFCADKNTTKRLDQFKELLANHNVEAEKISKMADMIGGFLGSLDDTQTERWSAEQAHIALAYALLGAQEIGLDSCPMGGFDAAAFSRILQLPENLTPVVLLPVGFSTDQPRPKQRFEDLFI